MARNKHTLSNYKLFTGDSGFLYPCGLAEVLPRDTFQQSSGLFLRFSPMAAPVMHPVTVRLYHHWVPHRQVWPESEGGGWEQFITSGPDGSDAQSVPTITATPVEGDLLDYFGLPVGVEVTVSALPIRAFNRIFNEWYRDQDLVPERALEDVTIPKIAWEKDYFTTARPWPQKGPAVTLPVGVQAPIIGIGAGDSGSDGSGVSVKETGKTSTVTYPRTFRDAQQGVYLKANETTDYPEVYADLSNAEGINVTDFRQAMALQRYAEARARYGSRYVEYLRYLGVRGGLDERLQNPELLGGGAARVNISEVLQTANEAVPGRYGVGDLYGHGVAATRSNAYRRTFSEHGYIITTVSVRPRAIYSNGVHRTWMRRTREEFWQRELEHIGQQAVWSGEVYADATPYEEWAWQDRYDEYRSIPSTISGEFRSVLNYWHMARQFNDKPALNQEFVECDATKRIFNVQDNHTLWMAVQHNIVARRLLTANSTPRIL